MLIGGSGQIYQLPRLNTLFCHSFRISSSLRLTHRSGSRYPPKPHQQRPSQIIAPIRHQLSKPIQIAIHTDPENGIRLW